jgi:DNA-directed RNA polymerase specialized sigma24 family protein
MSTISKGGFDNPPDLCSESICTNLYLPLYSFVRSLVYSFHVPCWKGQEEDIVEDIVQETFRRAIERNQKAGRGEADPIFSLKHMVMIIARNYTKDLRRHDSRLLRIEPREATLLGWEGKAEQHGLLDFICESIDQELLFIQIAHEIAHFPEKQRTVLLIDLANRMCFDTYPTPLQKAFLQAGVELEQYRQPLPANARERSQYLSLLYYAYKRVANLPCIQNYKIESDM